ncbi:hypothetical protein [Actinobacillus arthritidis]|uniref:hypothetical protein n=1 Tax=Actinobacillus arthritidis TaxID=157339 RepID=UPI002442952B|nr:hypothetical protein [Actinobacillus arthritidis]WGE90122.1 hypothetical protein NYR89_04665 [Actinobacillus arthritidis]
MFKTVIATILLVSSISTMAYTTRNPYDPNIKSTCRDGSYSSSSGTGTCSGHGGVYR